MRILVLGAGGTGGYFGGRAAEAGADVTFLVRDARAARLREHGLVIRSPKGDARFDVRTVTASTLNDRYDLVLLSAKAYDIDSAIDALRPAVGDGTMILPLLNGVAHYDRLEAAFGGDKILGGLCHISATLGEAGEVLHLNDFHILTFGERAGGTSERCQRVQATLSTANFTTRLSENVMQDVWEKFAFLTPLAAMTCLMRGSVGAIVATQDGETLMRDMLAECQAVAAASGYPVRERARDEALAVLTKPGSPMTASMLRDLQAGHAVEADHVVGDMLRRGREHGLTLPLLQAAYCHLQVYLASRRA